MVSEIHFLKDFVVALHGCHVWVGLGTQQWMVRGSEGVAIVIALRHSLSERRLSMEPMEVCSDMARGYTLALSWWLGKHVSFSQLGSRVCKQIKVILFICVDCYRMMCIHLYRVDIF